ncbi:unnamed protein product, partial [Adineta steineri]
MAELIQFSETSFPHDFLDQEPYNLIYDPGKKIRDHRTELAPFDSIVNIHYEVNSLINEIWRSRNKQLFLTLILPNTTDNGVRQFLSDHNICNQEHLHSLFLIFLNGLRCHHDWMNSLELRRLRWCRSCTTELKRDLYEALYVVEVLFQILFGTLQICL